MRPPRFASDRAMVLGLALSVSMGYGALSYGYSVLITAGAAGSAFSTSVLSAAFGGSVLTGAAVAPLAGRLADRHGVRSLVLAGGAMGGIGLAAFAASTEPWHVLVAWWAVLGPTSAIAFYEPAYVAIDQWCPPDRRTHAVAVLTLSAGLSGPVSIPATTWLVQRMGWRSATLVLAAVFATVLTLVAIVTLRAAPPAPSAGGNDSPSGPARRPSLRTRRFVVLTVAGLLIYGAFEAALIHRIARFEQAGYDLGLAARWAAIAGLLSLPGRFLLPRLAGRRSATVLLALVSGCLAAAMALAVRPTSQLHLVGHFVLFGAALGAALPLRAVAMSRWYSGPSYGWIMGVQAAWIGVARAAGPALVGAGRDHVGEESAMAAVALAFAAGGLLVTLAEPRTSLRTSAGQARRMATGTGRAEV